MKETLTVRLFVIYVKANKNTATSTKLAVSVVANTIHTAEPRTTRQTRDARAVSARIVLATLAFSNLTIVR
jgi:hypothetical protein